MSLCNVTQRHCYDNNNNIMTLCHCGLTLMSLAVEFAVLLPCCSVICHCERIVASLFVALLFGLVQEGTPMTTRELLVRLLQLSQKRHDEVMGGLMTVSLRTDANTGHDGGVVAIADYSRFSVRI